jgi:hypothetical protein
MKELNLKITDIDEVINFNLTTGDFSRLEALGLLQMLVHSLSADISEHKPKVKSKAKSK